MKPAPISYHGGHSGQYCNHAKDKLEDIIIRYIELGFPVVGITEHIPPPDDSFLYPDEKEAGLTASVIQNQFGRYFQELDGLQKKYKDQITIYKGMETETISGYVSHVQALIKQFNPDYLVGSVHHVDDTWIDYSKTLYNSLVASLGSHEALYEKYFDLQYEMIKTLKPFIIGHFDLIRIYDSQYEARLSAPEIEKKIDRNLALIKSLGLVLDFNLRPLAKGKKEPYLAPYILKKARALGIQVVPGDDSHGRDQAGNHVDTAIEILTQYGFDTQWPAPRLFF